VLEHLPSKREALNSNPSTARGREGVKEGGRKKGRKEGRKQLENHGK
jgi:hypothetical protein